MLQYVGSFISVIFLHVVEFDVIGDPCLQKVI